MILSSKLHKKTFSKLWLIGTGYMGIEYAKVLKHLDKKFDVIGRGESSAKSFESNLNITPYQGGLTNALEKNNCPREAIVAVNVEELYKCTIELLNKGCKKILVEKPAGISLDEIHNIHELSKKKKSEIYVAYNRRFFNSVLTLQDKIKEDGGISSINFEFTELGFELKKNQKFKKGIMKKWLIANSSHVIDLVFYLAGHPKDDFFSTYYSGESNWHTPTKFHGAGVSIKSIPFSYQANWECPGRWGVDINTRNNRYQLRPMEELHYTKLGEFITNKCTLSKNHQDKFKPGLLEQCKVFFSGRTIQLCSISEHLNHFKYYIKIAGY